MIIDIEIKDDGTPSARWNPPETIRQAFYSADTRTQRTMTSLLATKIGLDELLGPGQGEAKILERAVTALTSTLAEARQGRTLAPSFLVPTDSTFSINGERFMFLGHVEGVATEEEATYLIVPASLHRPDVTYAKVAIARSLDVGEIKGWVKGSDFSPKYLRGLTESQQRKTPLTAHSGTPPIPIQGKEPTMLRLTASNGTMAPEWLEGDELRKILAGAPHETQQATLDLLAAQYGLEELLGTGKGRQVLGEQVLAYARDPINERPFTGRFEINGYDLTFRGHLKTDTPPCTYKTLLNPNSIYIRVLIDPKLEEKPAITWVTGLDVYRRAVGLQDKTGRRSR